MREGDEEMRLTATFVTLTILVALYVGLAFASERERGNELYQLLASESPHSRFVGQSYILGVMDATHSLNRVWRLPLRWTIPPEVSNGEIFKAVKKYLEQHPNERDKTAYVLINTALGSAFPPKK
jgi:hypothetical protein